jgi:hypothetical protein
LALEPGLHIKKHIEPTRRERHECTFIRERAGH